MRAVRRSAGSAQSNFSYYQQRSEPANANRRVNRKSLEKAQPTLRKRPPFVHHLPSLLLFIAMMTSFAYASTLTSNPKIVFIEGGKKANNTALRNVEEYRAAAHSFINKSFVNRSKFLIDTDGLSLELRRQFPEIASATVTIPIMGRRPVVEIESTKPAFVIASDGETAVVGENGIVLAMTHDVAHLSDMQLRTIDDDSRIKLEQGKPALPEDQARFIRIVLEQLAGNNIEVSAIRIPASAYDLYITIGGNYYVKFNVMEDPLQQTGSLVALLDNLAGQGIVPKEYVDVRVGERVFYK